MAVVTISRDLGSGGRRVARALADDPGLRCLDHEAILARIRAAGLRWETWTESFDEQAPRLWEKYDRSFRGFIALVQSTILDEAAAGGVVILGRGANYLLADTPFALSVRVVAPMETRISRLADRESIDSESAKWLVEKTDRERAGFLLTVYGRDGRDPADYDMVFNSGNMSLDEITGAVRKEIREKEKLKTEASMEALRMKALAASIKARLLTSLPFFMPTLEVEYSGGSIRLRGVVRLPREREMVMQTAKAVAGKVPLSNELKYRQ